MGASKRKTSLVRLGANCVAFAIAGLFVIWLGVAGGMESGAHAATSQPMVSAARAAWIVGVIVSVAGAVAGAFMVVAAIATFLDVLFDDEEQY